LLNDIALQLDSEGIKGREDGERGSGVGLFERGNEFKYFRQRGAINRGRRFIKGPMLFEEIWYLLILL